MTDDDLVQALAELGASRPPAPEASRARVLRLVDGAARRGGGLERQALPTGLIAAALACFAPRPAAAPLGAGGVEAARALGDALRDAATEWRGAAPRDHLGD